MIFTCNKNTIFTTNIWLCLVLAVAVLWPCRWSYAQGIVLDQIVAVVNNDVILRSEYDRRKQLIVSQIRSEGGIPPTGLLLQKQVLDAMINNKLQLQLASINEIDVPDEAVDTMIADIASRNNVSPQEFRNVLENDGFSFPVFREEIREEMMVRSLRTRQVEQKISVSDQEVQFYLSTLERQGATGLEYRLAHILLSSESVEEEALSNPELQARAAAVQEQFDAGEDFAIVAASFSDAGNAASGGELGWRRFNDIPSVFVNLLPEMKEGEIMGPVSSSSGLHFVTLLETRRIDQVMVSEARMRHIFVRITESMDEGLALDRIRIARQRILQGEDFAVVAADMSDDISNAVDGGVIGWVRAGERGSGFDRLMQTTEINALSEPFRSPGGWHIGQVLERRQHDDTEQKIKDKARESIYRRKLDSAYRSWLSDMRNEAYIEVRLEDQGSQG